MTAGTMAGEVSLEFMTGNPQLGVLSGRLTHLESSGDRVSGAEEGKGYSRTPNNSINSGGGSSSSSSGRFHTNDSIPDTASPLGRSADSLRHDHLPDRRSKLLCILSVPAHMVPTDMLQFAAPFKEQVHCIRILRPCNPAGPSDPARTPAEYMVLLQMESQSSADDFFLQYNGKRFNSFEETVCHVVFVATATFDLDAASCPSPSSPPGSRARPTMTASPSFDASASASSAAAAAARGGDSPPSAAEKIPALPALHASLRFSPARGGGISAAATAAAAAAGAGGGFSPEKAAAAAAATAAAAAAAAATPTAEDAVGWEYDASTCVICMDRMESRVLTTVCNHSFHVECLMKWQDSPCPVCRFHHNNASEASTCQECQATDNLWVCLICGSVLCGSRHEDHVGGHYTSTLHAYAIEIETQQVWDFAGDGFVHRLIHNKADGKLVEVSDPSQTSEERPQMPACLSDIQEERLVHGKLEGLAYQYNTLLTSQLDEQRHFYQKQLNGLMEQQEKTRRERKARMVSGADLVSALRQQRRELESKCASASTRLRKIREETGFLWELNRSLEANKPQLSANLEQAQRDLDSARKAREEWVPKLEEKVAALMLKLDAGVAAAAAAAAAAAGTGAAAAAGGAVAAGTTADGGSGDDRSRISCGSTSDLAASSSANAGARSYGIGGGQASEKEARAEKLTVSSEKANGGRLSAGDAISGNACKEVSAEGGAAGAEEGRRVDDDRGWVPEGAGRDSLASAGQGGGSSSGKKKGRRRRSK